MQHLTHIIKSCKKFWILLQETKNLPSAVEASIRRSERLVSRLQSLQQLNPNGRQLGDQRLEGRTGKMVEQRAAARTTVIFLNTNWRGLFNREWLARARFEICSVLVAATPLRKLEVQPRLQPESRPKCFPVLGTYWERGAYSERWIALTQAAWNMSGKWSEIHSNRW